MSVIFEDVYIREARRKRNPENLFSPSSSHQKRCMQNPFNHLPAIEFKMGRHLVFTYDLFDILETLQFTDG